MTQLPRTIPLLLLALAWPGCGERSVNADDDAGGPDHGLVSQDLGGGDSLATQGACLIATRVDECCHVPRAAAEAEVAADPCLVPFPARTIPAVCKARWPNECAAVRCGDDPPLTRVVGRGADGRCAFQSECQSAANCTYAVDSRECCSCPAAWPRAVVEREYPCLKPAPPIPAGPGPEPVCPEMCLDAMVCGACPPLEDQPRLDCVGYGDQLLHGLKSCWSGTPPP